MVYLATNKVAGRAFKMGVGLLDNINGSKSSSRFSSGEVDLDKVEPDKPNAKLGPSPLWGRAQVLPAILEGWLVVGSKNYTLFKWAGWLIRLRAHRIIKISTYLTR